MPAALPSRTLEHVLTTLSLTRPCRVTRYTVFQRSTKNDSAVALKNIGVHTSYIVSWRVTNTHQLLRPFFMLTRRDKQLTGGQLITKNAYRYLEDNLCKQLTKISFVTIPRVSLHHK